jgi:hypothetical protein
LYELQAELKNNNLDNNVVAAKTEEKNKLCKM